MIIIFNCGSSSIKSALFGDLISAPILTVLAERIGQDDAQIVFKTSTGEKQRVQLTIGDYEAAFQCIADYLKQHDFLSQIKAVGHRVVHGGNYFNQSVLIDQSVCDTIESLVPLAPLHNPANLMGIRFAQKILPDVLQVASFDTAFHQTMPETQYRYAIPTDWYDQHHIRKYGFHGMSHQYVSARAAEELGLARGNFITAHLGNGCSITAIQNGQSIDTSMGFTPLDGVMMGTRSGSIDPGIFSYLQQQCDFNVDQVTDALNKNSGLKGICGYSDMREIEALVDQGDMKAKLAFELFCYRIAKTISSYLFYFEQLDALVFTGGIGENSIKVRERVLELLKYVPQQYQVLVIPTNEELMIAMDVERLTG